jgi:hypothetical protein
MSDLEDLMRDVARTVQGDARRRQLLPEIQARLAALDDQSRQAQRVHGTWRLTLAGAALCAAGIAIFVLRPNPLSYAVDSAGAGHAGAVGERLVASEAAPMALRFSDGSQVTLSPWAQAHVDALDTHGATVALEEGTVEVSVVHRAHTRWEIRAGRYHIRVTGTRFAAGWDRRTDALTVTMHEGSVEVTGPGMKAPARVVTGQRLRTVGAGADDAADAPEVIVEDATTAAPQAAAPEAAAAAPAAEATGPSEAPEVVQAEAARPQAAATRPAASVRGSHARHAAAAPTTVAENDWRELEAQHHYKDAFARAQDDWDGKCERLPAEDLMKLGNIARYAGKNSYAEAAFQAAHRRFPNAPEPVYYLGLVAFDGHRNYAAAAKLFDEYIRRYPRGALICEATGRLLESRLNAGDNGGARAAADSYLNSCKNGSHTAMARDTVGH